MAEAKIVVFSVKGMTCGGCAEAVKRVIRKADPDADISVELSSGRVEAKTKAEGGSLAAAITKAGYEAAVAA
ncbi:MAG: heavy-metal-associated domain-containing protein [Hyphomicrobiales bacterium]|nr:heavy-metal-associated domain-containing protein [Hyphomicrobiales bacterium]NBR11409.1 copper chaperone [Alphaproteobacteria bacterium]